MKTFRTEKNLYIRTTSITHLNENRIETTRTVYIGLRYDKNPSVVRSNTKRISARK